MIVKDTWESERFSECWTTMRPSKCIKPWLIEKLRCRYDKQQKYANNIHSLHDGANLLLYNITHCNFCQLATFGLIYYCVVWLLGQVLP